MSRAARSIGAVAVAALLSGCVGGVTGGGGALPGASNSAPSAVRANKAKPVVFIPNLSSTVTFYSANIHEHNPPALGDITEGVTRAEAVWVDRHGVLYVLNSEPYPSVEEYKPETEQPFMSLSDKLYEPASVAVDRSGTVYVDDQNAGNPVVYEYAGGSSVSKTVAIPNVGRDEIGPLAVDPKGNVFIGGFDVESQSSFLFEIPTGGSKAKQITLNSFPGEAIAFDAKGNLFSCGQAGNCAVYPPGAKNPSRTIYTTNEEVFGGIAVTANGTLYVPSYSGELLEYAPGKTYATNSFVITEGAFDAAVGPP